MDQFWIGIGKVLGSPCKGQDITCNSKEWMYWSLKPLCHFDRSATQELHQSNNELWKSTPRIKSSFHSGTPSALKNPPKKIFHSSMLYQKTVLGLVMAGPNWFFRSDRCECFQRPRRHRINAYPLVETYKTEHDGNFRIDYGRAIYALGVLDDSLSIRMNKTSHAKCACIAPSTLLASTLNRSCAEPTFYCSPSWNAA